LVIPCQSIQTISPSRRVQMAEATHTHRQDNEPVHIAVWYDYI